MVLTIKLVCDSIHVDGSYRLYLNEAADRRPAGDFIALRASIGLKGFVLTKEPSGSPVEPVCAFGGVPARRATFRVFLTSQAGLLLSTR